MISKPLRAGAASAALAAFLLAAGPASARTIVVPSDGDDTVRLVESTTMAQIGAPIALPGSPSHAAVSPDGATAWVTADSADAAAGADKVVRIDLATRTVTPVTVGEQPMAVVVNPAGTRAYVGNFVGQSVTVVDTASATPVATVTGLGQVDGLAVTPDGSSVLVADSSGNALRFIDASTNTVTGASVGLGGNARRIAVTPEGDVAYVSVQSVGIKRIDLASRTAAPETLGGGKVLDVVLEPATGRLFGAYYDPAGVNAFSTEPGAALGAPWPIGVPANPSGLAVDPSGRRIYVQSHGNSNGPLDKGVVRALNVLTGAQEGVDYEFPATFNDVVPAVAPNQAPTAAFSAAPGFAGEQTTFDASASTDPDGSVARYDWDFGDGTRGDDAGPTPKHTYAAPGSYTVTLEVTDDDGGSTRKVWTGKTYTDFGQPSARLAKTVTVTTRPAATTDPGPPVTPGPVTPPPLTPVDRTAPKLTALRVAPAVLTRRSRLSYRLDEAASVAITVERRTKGRRLNGACVPATRLLRRARACVRWAGVAGASVTRRSAAGATSFAPRFRLPAGSYRVVAVATDAAGNTARPVTFPLRVKRAR